MVGSHFFFYKFLMLFLWPQKIWGKSCFRCLYQSYVWRYQLLISLLYVFVACQYIYIFIYIHVYMNLWNLWLQCHLCIALRKLHLFKKVLNSEFSRLISYFLYELLILLVYLFLFFFIELVGMDSGYLSLSYSPSAAKNLQKDKQVD